MSLRAVEIAETERGFRVSTDCRSRPEAIAAACALFNAPPSQAFQTEYEAYQPPELSPEVAELVERDPDTYTESLKHGEAV